MPSSITLTVSHLPSSTSFFLSALQPLKYTFRGRSGDCVSFGPETSNTPPDFWITQEVPGVPAGAAHVAFQAPSRTAVQDFFVAALKAGGKIHGEPCIRDQHGYYSAAVIDFDGNSIEAVYRPCLDDANKENESQTVVSRQNKALTQVSRAPSVASSGSSRVRSTMVSQTPPAASLRPQRPSTGDALDNIIHEARSAANVARDLVNQVRPHLASTQSAPAAPIHRTNKTPDDAVMGTLLGVAAGAAITWALKSNDSKSERDRPRPRRSSTTGRDVPHEEPYYKPSGYRYVEAPPSAYSHGRYVSMRDNEHASATPPRPHRRGSYDSGIGSGPDSTASSHRSGRKMIEAPPPSSYRGPTQPYMSSTNKPRRSSSQSRHSNPDSHKSDTKTIYHLQEVRRRSTHPPPSAQSSSSAASKHSYSSTTVSQRTARQDDYYMPAPPTRATTWTAGERSDTGKSRHSSGKASYVAAKPSKSGSKSKHKGSLSVGGDSEMTKSVIGKVREMRRLDVTDDELRPSDSVSQVSSSVRSGRRGRT